mmetsp:Transcript_4698/g.11219  ORF Transcript_4698/g.11219 Transcript_4698/m.11219 type:complete len:244 (-) Transcript_4698:90-821(-)|eukprot:CAMPEP_0181444506 /NCGR_PEP_ID=MMETSP1110-20121109/25104_1 /TAXON_ID=174948 /ORGANISM="Symbiodinium sp., Strain CCMP421" /LENGTH=243 /DNA_ID=CAMNT_0023568515 /DNA_START=175 /DNA_END=906 /DNA_ORIENTATION=-
MVAMVAEPMGSLPGTPFEPMKVQPSDMVSLLKLIQDANTYSFESSLDNVMKLQITEPQFVNLSADEPAARRARKKKNANRKGGSSPSSASSSSSSEASLGSLGHPWMCRRPCVYVATHKAACPNGSDCNYCHLRHPQRRATFDKRQREFFRSLEEGDLLSVILPHLKTKAASMPPSAQKVLGLLSARCLAARQGSSVQVELPENLNAVLEHMNFAWLVTLAPCKDEPELSEAMEALRSDCAAA